jgi:hypothetical protein
LFPNASLAHHGYDLAVHGILLRLSPPGTPDDTQDCPNHCPWKSMPWQPGHECPKRLADEGERRRPWGIDERFQHSVLRPGHGIPGGYTEECTGQHPQHCPQDSASQYAPEAGAVSRDRWTPACPPHGSPYHSPYCTPSCLLHALPDHDGKSLWDEGVLHEHRDDRTQKHTRNSAPEGPQEHRCQQGWSGKSERGRYRTPRYSGGVRGPLHAPPWGGGCHRRWHS